MTDLTDFFGEPIHIYTRAQAIDDGTLVDGGPEIQQMCREAGFRWPVAFTATAWADAVAWDGDGWQDVKGRLWDVLMVARFEIAKLPLGAPPEMPIKVLRVPNDGHSHRTSLCHLVVHVGPGDNAEPVITVMRPGED